MLKFIPRFLINTSLRRSAFAVASLFIIVSCVFSATMATNAQTIQSPRRERLLNGLTILQVSPPATTSDKVLLKLRVQGGAAFDLANKEGMTRLLADSLFPDAEIAVFVREELDGQFDVATDYDAITVTLSARASEFERLVELLRNAIITNTTIPAETFKNIQNARIKLATSNVDSTLLAERAARQRLFGESYPLGRAPAGTPASLARVDANDLLLARERFLNPNNSTIAVVGNIERPRLLRTFKQLLGAWRKSDRVIPATFRQPETTTASTLIIDTPQNDGVILSYAARGIARVNRDATAAEILANIAQARWRKALNFNATTPNDSPNYTVRHEAHDIGGVFLFRAAFPASQTARVAAQTTSVIKSLAANLTATEFEAAKREFLTRIQTAPLTPEIIADRLLAAEIYGANIADQIQAANNIKFADVQRLARESFTDANVSRVFVGNAATLKPALEINNGATNNEIQIVGLTPEIGAQTLTTNKKASTAPLSNAPLSNTTTPANPRPLMLPVPRRP